VCGSVDVRLCALMLLHGAIVVWLCGCTVLHCMLVFSFNCLMVWFSHSVAVCSCVFVFVRYCGCVVVWFCAVAVRAVLWLRDCAVVWLCVSAVVWQQACVLAWLCVCVMLRLRGRAVVRALRVYVVYVLVCVQLSFAVVEWVYCRLLMLLCGRVVVCTCPGLIVFAAWPCICGFEAVWW